MFKLAVNLKVKFRFLKRYFFYFLSISLAFSLVFACSPTKNTFVSRNMNALGTKFNVLYNGQLALDKGLKELDEGYHDNFYERIPIEPLKVDEKLLRPSLKGNTNFQNFDRAEEKAVKAVQTHGMTIKGVEHNKQIDEAYLLLGKARYYTQRFVPAFDAFSHSIKNDSKANLIYETKLWQAKTQIRLQNEEVAIESLQNMLRFNKVPETTVEDSYTAIAMAYSQIDSIHQVIKHLKLATKIGFNPVQNSRNLIVLGQLYREEAQIDSSNLSFNKLLNYKKAPYNFKVQAEIEIAKNYDASKDSVGNVLMMKLEKMVKDFNNIPYLGALYYVIGDISQKNKDFNQAKNYYNLTLTSKSSDKIQKILAYEQLANINIDEKKYVIAGKYYDSIIRTSEDIYTKKLRQIIRKSDKLADVIMFDGLAQRNDSILRITKLDSATKVDLFKNHIAKLQQREKDSIQQALADVKAKELNNQPSFIGASASKSSFYFYNNELVGFGKLEFIKVWGARKLADNWRYSDNSSVDLAVKIITKDSVKTKISQKYQISFYLNQIPTSVKEIDSITNIRNDAYFQLGQIYKEQFKDYPMAIHYLESLLNLKPSKDRILPIHYNLYKIFSVTDSIKARDEKDFIITNYPDSRYAQLILKPGQQLVFADNDSPETQYKIAYNYYEEGNFVLVDSLATKALETYQGLPIIPKYKLLKAYAIVKLDGYKAFSELLTAILLEFPNTPEGKKAKNTLDLIKDDLAKADDFTAIKDKDNLILAYQVPNKLDLSKLENQLTTIVQNEDFSNLSVETKPYNRSTKLFLIKGFSDKDALDDFTYFINKKYKIVLPKDFFVISQTSYNKIQLYKNLNIYLKK